MVSRDESERDLVLRSQRGDREAFGKLVRLHMQRAYFAALGFLGSHDDALDVSQEAFAKAFDARGKLDPERPFYPWLYQILRRLSFNLIRDRKRRTEKLATQAGWVIEDRARQSRSDPAGELEANEVRELLAAALERLSDAEREVLVLKEFEDLKYREIAELLDVPIGTVMSRLYAARKSLAALLEDRL